MYSRTYEPAGVNITTWSTDPVTSYDALNQDTILIGFEVDVAANATASPDVRLIPVASVTAATFDKSLDEW